MGSYLAVFIGGGLGSMARLALSRVNLVAFPFFPVGTLLANLLACAVLGLVSGYFLSHNDHGGTNKVLLTTGFCGGFSTFSTFSAETLKLIEQGNQVMAFCYVSGSVILGIACVVLGMSIGKQIG